MRKIVFWLSLVMIFTIPWEGAFHLPGFGTAATIMGLIVTALWIALVAMTGQMRRPVTFPVATSSKRSRCVSSKTAGSSTRIAASSLTSKNLR